MVMWLRRSLLFAGAAMLSAVCGGCGGNSHGLDLAPVEGTVTFRGAPLPNAQVVFLPDVAGQLPASGVTDNKGHYRLMTIKPGDGANLGKHRVTVTARVPDRELPEGELTTGLPG